MRYGKYISRFLRERTQRFAVGVADRKELITGADIKAGDVLIGIASSGVHSNGFSLVRKVFEMTKESLTTYYDELGMTLGEALITPTKIYVKTLKAIKDAGVTVKGCGHYTFCWRRRCTVFAICNRLVRFFWRRQ